MYQKVTMALMEERQQHATAINEFKQVNNHTIYIYTVIMWVCMICCCMKQTIKHLDDKNRNQQENLRKELQAVKVVTVTH